MAQLSKVLKVVCWAGSVIVQELCESGGGRPGLSVLTSLLVSVDVTDYIAPCFGIGHNLSLICLMTSEDIKHQFIIIINGSVPFPSVSLQRQVVC